MLAGKKGERGFGRIDTNPAAEGVIGMQEIGVVESDFVAAKSQVIVKAVTDRAVEGKIRSAVGDGDIVGGDSLERAVDGWIGK